MKNLNFVLFNSYFCANLNVQRCILMKIVDCFIFYNELEMLKYRLEVLDKVVDNFVLVESHYTFSGKEKKLYYNENKEMFEKYNHKITHIMVTSVPFIYPNINFKDKNQWENEYYQRNCINAGLQHLSLNNEDVFTILDVDEIPDPVILQKIKNNEIKVTLNSLEQDFYYYNLNSKILNKWYFSKIISYKIFVEEKLTCNQLRWSNLPAIESGGWHLSYFGDKYFIQDKINNFSHQELNIPEYSDLDAIQNKIDNTKDLYNRDDNPMMKISVQFNTYLPPEYKTKLNKFILF